ncbi:uncharacterized protein LOC135388089 isoform X2 [Ornithodoros turicata]|uniref:uncharacterized protein LOC135388089 isoform X2 n=1 Tax=Ornithodoros turicata TaxID=34597 RepID=UPI0031389387
MTQTYSYGAMEEDTDSERRVTRHLSLSVVDIADDRPLLSTRTACCERLTDKVWLVPVLYTHFFMAAGTMMNMAFYPPLASSRGLAAWKFGFVFSAYKVGMLLGAFISERVVYKASPRAGYLGGQGGQVICLVLFGALYWINGAEELLAWSMIFALACNATAVMYFASMFAVQTSVFRDKAGLLIASLEFLFGLGGLVGAVIGGALIDLWAYPLPYFAVAAMLCLSLPFMTMIRPQWKREAAMENKRKLVTSAYFKLLTNPSFLTDMITAAIPLGMMAFNEDTLEPYLRNFHLTNTQIGLVFTVQCVGYCTGSLLSGYFSINKLETTSMFLGTTLCAISYLMIGPAPFINMEPSLGLMYLSCALMGLGGAALFTCGYMHGLRTAILSGYPDDIRTNSVVASIVFVNMFLSSVGTAPLAGYLTQEFGYRAASTALSGFLFTWTAATFVLWVSEVKVCIRTGKKYGDL